MNLDLKEDFEVLEEGTSYALPKYKVEEGTGLIRRIAGSFTEDSHVKLDFVRGSKLGEEDVERRVGTLHEHVLAVMIHDLKFKSKLVPSRETALAITKLEEALMWLRQRQIDRLKREVEGTYQK